MFHGWIIAGQWSTEIEVHIEILISLQNTAKFHVISPRKVCPHEAATTILVKIFWNFNILVQVRFTTSKTKLELPHELPHILGNQEILEKSQIWLETKASRPPRNLTLAAAAKNHAKNGYETFPSLSNITGSLYSVPNTLIA